MDREVSARNQLLLVIGNAIMLVALFLGGYALGWFDLASALLGVAFALIITGGLYVGIQRRKQRQE